MDVEGVEGQLRVKENHTPTNHERKPKRTSVRGQAWTKTSGGRRRSYSVDEDVETALPTAADLAQSFLQTEPEEERAELEAAMLSETQELGTSSVLSDSEDGDSEIPLGTGTALSLPAFMARFLKGIVDRLQIRIQGVTLNLDVDIPSEASKSTQTAATDPVIVQLIVDSIDIEGVTHDLEIKTSTEKDGTRLPYKIGKRLICLNNIRGALITEANLFSSLARSSALSSPSAAHSDAFDDHKFTRSRNSRRGSEYSTLDGASSQRPASASSSSKLPSTFLSRKANDPHASHDSLIESDSGRFDDAPEDESFSGSVTGDLDSDVGDSVFQNSAYLDQVTESQYDEGENNEGIVSLARSYVQKPRHTVESNSPLSTPKASMHLPSIQDKTISYLDPAPSDKGLSHSMVHSITLSMQQRSRFSAKRVSQSQSALPAENAPSATSPAGEDPPLDTSPVPESDNNGDEYDDATPVGEEDLAQSQLFSHEDAESMYMSAVSYGSSSGRMPGDWTHSSSGSGNANSSPSSPIKEQRPLDNLNHARHISPTQSSAELGSLDKPLTSSTPHPRKAPSPQPMPVQQIPSVSQASSNASERSTTSSDDLSRMRKQIFLVDQVVVYLPDTSSELVGTDAPQNSAMFSSTFDGSDATASSSANVPGAFSPRLSPRRTPQNARTNSQVAEKKPETASDTDESIEVDFGQLLAHFDMSVGRLIWKLIQRLKEAMKPVSQTEYPTPKTSFDLNLKVSAKEISLKFLERLEGILAHPSARPEIVPWTEAPESDILLRAGFQGLSMDMRKSQSTLKTVVNLRKFVFGYAQEDIVSFDAGFQMRSSVRDLKASVGLDLSISILQTANTTRIDIKTLPFACCNRSAETR